MKMGEPKPLQFVELGPGRGTLMLDVLRTFLRIKPEALKDVSLHLVEVSDAMKRLQEGTLCGYFHGSPGRGISTDVLLRSFRAGGVIIFAVFRLVDTSSFRERRFREFERDPLRRAHEIERILVPPLQRTPRSDVKTL